MTSLQSADRFLHTAAPVLGAVFALSMIAPLTTGCSQDVQTSELSTPIAPPPLLSIHAPLAESRLSSADDVRVDIPGLQVDVRVLVEDVKNGVHLESVQLITPEGDVITAPVTTTRGGGREAIFTSVTLLTAPQGALNSLLIVASNDIEDSETWVHVHAAGPDIRANACDAPVVYQGNVVIADGNLPFSAPATECVILDGDLRIEETAAARVNELDGVVEVTGDLIISTNVELTELNGLAGIVAIGGNLHITRNPSLPTNGEAFRLRDAIGLSNIGGAAIIDGNGPG